MKTILDNKKGEYKVEHILIGVMIVSALFSTMALFYDDLTSNYPVNNYYEENTTSYTETFQDIQDDSEQIDEAIRDLSSGNLADIFGGLLQGLFGILGLLYDSFIGIGLMLTQSIGLFDLGTMGPIWMATAATGVILIFVLGIRAKVIK